jgi:benzoyl-CoA reductase/2-hydroxyglutaryl-CoA dehydratase subunit BcrC/BadD/HgdB
MLRKDADRSGWIEPRARRISSKEWRRLFSSVPAELIDGYRYYRDCGKTNWNTYLIPPSTFAAYGARYLQKLRFDNSLASLRLWGFMLTESERLYRARQTGRNVIAVMGDLGPLSPLVYSFPNTVAFYPECHWWTPFLFESNDLFDAAAKRGIGEDCCFVRAALGAFAKNCYFPPPQLCIACVGATCDDMAAVIQGAYALEYPFFWFEIPYRRDWNLTGEEGISKGDSIERNRLKSFVVKQLEALILKIEEATQTSFREDSLSATIRQVNRFRRAVQEARRYSYQSLGAALPALEMMNLEFMGLAFYADLPEAVDIAEHLAETARRRSQSRDTAIAPQSVRVFWVTPPADPILLNHLEDLGGQVVGSEYVIHQIREPLREDLPPLEALAEGILNMSLIGSSGKRAQYAIGEAKEAGAEGVIISSIFASSHCASEDRIIAEEIKKTLEIPVLAFDVVGPGKERQQSQTLNRMQAFVEVLQARRRRNFT